MRSDTPEDQIILHYWALHKNGELEPESVVDLGTMLFHRGFPNDAIRMYRQALKADSRLFEAWFRIGLVSYHLAEFDDARHAYKKCLKIAPDHGWCGFYSGLLEEETGHPSRALELYRRAFESAPELADPAVNSEVLQSRLYLGALLMAGRGEVGPPPSRTVPPPGSEDADSVPSRDVAPPLAPTAGTAAAAAGGTPPPQAAPSSERPAGTATEVGTAPTRASVSPEASLAPLWPTLPEWILALI
jgi:tetratricopeptide (TPR) repeat protein